MGTNYKPQTPKVNHLCRHNHNEYSITIMIQNHQVTHESYGFSTGDCCAKLAIFDMSYQDMFSLAEDIIKAANEAKAEVEAEQRKEAM